MTLRRLPALMDDVARDLLEAEFRSRALADARQYAREHKAEIDAEWNALPDTIPAKEHARRHVAAMTPERRAQVGDW